MNPFLAGQEFDACVGGEWFHIIVMSSQLSVGTFDPMRLSVDMVLLPLDERPAPLTIKDTQSSLTTTLQIEKGS